MEILIMQVFVSLLLVAGAVLLFAWSVKQADHEHADRLALFPIDDDEKPTPSRDAHAARPSVSRNS